MEQMWAIIADVAETVGVVFALVAVIVAAWSVRQSSRDARLQLQVTNFREYSKLYFELFSGKADLLSLSSLENLDFMNKYFGMCYQEYILAGQGVLHKDVWAAWTQTIKENINKEAFRKGWNAVKTKSHFSSDYTQFIEALIEYPE